MQTHTHTLKCWFCVLTAWFHSPSVCVVVLDLREVVQSGQNPSSEGEMDHTEPNNGSLDRTPTATSLEVWRERSGGERETGVRRERERERGRGGCICRVCIFELMVYIKTLQISVMQ